MEGKLGRRSLEEVKLGRRSWEEAVGAAHRRALVAGGEAVVGEGGLGHEGGLGGAVGAIAAVPLLHRHKLGQDVVEGELEGGVVFDDGDDCVVDGGEALDGLPEEVFFFEGGVCLLQLVVEGFGAAEVLDEGFGGGHLEGA